MKGCRIKISSINNKIIKCGDKLLGKIRLCSNCNNFNKVYLATLINVDKKSKTKMNKQEIINKIDELIDHYEPYRPLSDLPENKEVRKVLTKLKEFINQNE